MVVESKRTWKTSSLWRITTMALALMPVLRRRDLRRADVLLAMMRKTMTGL
jgi:hypothetical protein